MLSDALSYPQSGDGWRSVLIGGLLTFFSWLLIPGFIVWGYYMRVLRGVALEEEEAPRFDDWGDLLVDGFKSFLIVMGYLFLPMLLVFVLAFVAFLIGGEDLGVVLALLVGLFGIVVMLGMIYLLPVALTAFALTDRLGAAFEIGSVTASAFTGDYGVSVLLSTILSAGVGMALGMILYIIQIVFGFVFVFGMVGLGGPDADPALSMGMLLISFIVGMVVYMVIMVIFTIVQFYTEVATYHLLGQGCGPSLREELSINRPTPERAPQVGPELPEER